MKGGACTPHAPPPPGSAPGFHTYTEDKYTALGERFVHFVPGEGDGETLFQPIRAQEFLARTCSVISCVH